MAAYQLGARLADWPGVKLLGVKLPGVTPAADGEGLLGPTRMKPRADRSKQSLRAKPAATGVLK